MAAHILLQWAHVIEGIVSLVIEFVSPAVEAGGRAVTEYGGVRVAAVGGFVFGHGVSTVPTITTLFV